MARMKIEKPNWNWFAFTLEKYAPRNAPEMPPNAPPVAYASSFVFTSGTPMLAAATSSSRRAIQARPSFESRRRMFTNSTTSTIANDGPVVRPQVERRVERVQEREVDRVDRGDRLAAVRQLVVADDRDLVAVLEDAADDLAERERDDRDVVAAQSQRRQADDRPRDGADEDRPDQDEQEVDVDSGQRRREPAHADVDALLAAHAGVEVGRPPAHRHRAERVERHVAEVEQAREADHQVQAQRHHHVGERQDAVVHEAVERRAEQREQRDRQEHDDGQDVLRPLARAQLPEGVHPASLVSSPISPCGLNTMIRTR